MDDGDYGGGRTLARLGSLYGVLEISEDATAEEVLRGYKKVSAKYHPSRSKHELSLEHFERACVAYCILRDPERRKRYNYDGQERWLRAEKEGAEAMYSEVHGGRPAHGRSKPRDTVVEVPLPLSAFYNGRSTRVQIKRTRLCGACEGLGIMDEGLQGLCLDCRGKGMIRMAKQYTPTLTHQSAAPCPSCKGTGVRVSPKDHCRTCTGRKTVTDSKQLQIVVEKGMAEGDHFVFQAEGDELPGVDLPGDVFVVLVETKHETFKRRGPDLMMEHDISLAESLTGFHLVFNHLDGRQLIVQPTRGTVVAPNRTWHIEREGMPHRENPATFGRLVVSFNVTFPEWVTSEQSVKLARLLNKPPQQVLLDEGVQERTLVASDAAPGPAAGKHDGAGFTAPMGIGGDESTAACVHQ